MIVGNRKTHPLGTPSEIRDRVRIRIAIGGLDFEIEIRIGFRNIVRNKG